MVIVNIGIAYQKWSYTSEIIQPNTPQKIKLDSFFAGVATGFITPNMLGNFLGRMLYFPPEKRASITVLTQFSNFGQFIASTLFGTIALVFLEENLLSLEGKSYYITISGIVLFVALLGFFFFDRFLRFLPVRWNLDTLSETLQNKSIYRWQILGLSLVRFLIFTTQFALILSAFTNEISAEIILGIWLVYLITLLFPSLVLGKLSIKEVVAINVLIGFGVNEVAILFSSLIIWLVNSCLPAVVGIIIYRKPNA